MKSKINRLNENELQELLEKIKNSPTIERSHEEIMAEPLAQIPYSVIKTWPTQEQKKLLIIRKALASCQCEKCKSLRENTN